MKVVNVRFTEGEHAELVKLARVFRRTVAAQVSYMVNTNLPNLSHQRREHDTDTDPQSISETLGLDTKEFKK